MFSLGYAISRYLLLGDVAFTQLPVFIANKAIALFALLLLFASSLAHQRGQKLNARRLGHGAWHAGLVHLGLSLAIFSPAYYDNFFDQQQLSLAGELLVLFGVLAGYLFWRLSEAQSHRLIWLKLALYSLLAGHLLPMGGSWLSPSLWPGGLPPISLLAFALLLGTAMVTALTLLQTAPPATQALTEPMQQSVLKQAKYILRAEAEHWSS